MCRGNEHARTRWQDTVATLHNDVTVRGVGPRAGGEGESVPFIATLLNSSHPDLPFTSAKESSALTDDEYKQLSSPVTWLTKVMK
ncbi:hypothetical protein E2C01_088012 [Portunus trituberculatus]|uniref:Uncharacterized protein n=1 Tax=Portunus trituberculatus TaxID=210409 RepID=A0A5B7JDC5_PORTR|nr:hypothetical protein [Portunus trituberculatus]